MKPAILVTGGAGYIGSHTVIELANAGFEPILIDDLSNSSSAALTGIATLLGYSPAFYPIDLLNTHALDQVLQQHPNLSAVIHFAAFKAVGESVLNPLKYYRNNLDSLLNLLIAHKGQALNFIFSSSCTVYGQPDRLPVTEESPFKPAESPYGFTKQVCERILEDTSKTENFKIISLRYFNPVGAHSSALIGEQPSGIPQNLVPFITQAAIGKRKGITVFGNDYPTPDGTCIRDYIHVVDVAKAHVKACERLLNPQVFGENKSGFFECYNLGTGKGSSVMEVLLAFERVNGVTLDYSIGPRRPGDVVEVWGDVHKAKEVLGWRAELGLDDMVQTAWKWETHLAALEKK